MSMPRDKLLALFEEFKQRARMSAQLRYGTELRFLSEEERHATSIQLEAVRKRMAKEITEMPKFDSRLPRARTDLADMEAHLWALDNAVQAEHTALA